MCVLLNDIPLAAQCLPIDAKHFSVFVVVCGSTIGKFKLKIRATNICRGSSERIMKIIGEDSVGI